MVVRFDVDAAQDNGYAREFCLDSKFSLYRFTTEFQWWCLCLKGNYTKVLPPKTITTLIVFLESNFIEVVKFVHSQLWLVIKSAYITNEMALCWLNR